MTRLNILLILIVIACALSVVTSQHNARKLFMELERKQERTRQLTVEWGQLQLEQSTWAMRARVEKIATKQLLMKVPDASKIKVISLAGPNNSISFVDEQEL
ncbi:MAG: cell division protein FtsL [Betaproteobacteria bacterium]|nr:MAG: cell division protein FtsL [Betaproteobacteria bacterium]